jgi:beta-lactamase class D
VNHLRFFAGCLTIVFTACSSNNVTEYDNLKKYFDSSHATGCFGLYDNAKGHFAIYNLPRFRDSLYSPASTFKIVHSLIGLQTGRVTNEKTAFAWNGVQTGNKDCERDMNMEDAFRISCPAWYQQLALKIGKDTLQQWLDTLGYASKKGRFAITNNANKFWLDNTLKITADEELGLMKKLYFDQLPFQKRPQEIVRKMMLWENNANYKLSYKTGLAILPNTHQLGWMVGWIEENKRPYFFVLQVELANAEQDMKAIRTNLLQQILKQYGFFEGKK